MEFLPKEQIKSVDKNNFIRSTILPIVLLLTANFLTYALFQLNNPNRGYDVIQYKWKLAQKNQNVDWLILGDSSGNQGFNNEVFNTERSTTSINLCTTGDMLLKDDYWLLNKYLKHNSPPKSIILIHTYDVLCRNEIPESSFNQIPNNVNNTNLDDKNKYSWYKQLIPLAYQKTSLTKVIRDPTLIFSKDYSFNEFGQQIISRTYPNKLNQDLEQHVQLIENNSINISNENKEALKSITNLAKENKIKVYFFPAPLWNNAMQNHGFEVGYHKIMQDWHLICQSNNVINLSMEPLLFDTEEMESSIDHIRYSASKRYTQSIIKCLK